MEDPPVSASLPLPPGPTPGSNPAQAANSHLDWTQEEQSLLEQLLVKFPMDKFAPVERYLRIANELTVRFVLSICL